MSRQTGAQRPGKKGVGAWVVRIVLITFVLAFAMSAVAEAIQDSLPIWAAVALLLFFISTGILFDIIGIAIASAEEKPFVAMSAKKVPGAMAALSLLKKADRVSNFCNDVVGDVCGIVSGAMGAYVAVFLAGSAAGRLQLVAAICVSSVIAALTVGGKALGKRFAMTRRRRIVLAAGQAIHFFTRRES